MIAQHAVARDVASLSHRRLFSVADDREDMVSGAAKVTLSSRHRCNRMKGEWHLTIGERARYREALVSI